MPARTCERRCRKRKRISDIIDDRDACFFWAAHRLAALACLFKAHDSLPVDVSLQHFPFGRAALSPLSSSIRDGMLNGGFRVRAAPDKNIGTSPAQVEKTSPSVALPEPLHPVSSDRALLKPPPQRRH
jgi:hypothetical protein